MIDPLLTGAEARQVCSFPPWAGSACLTAYMVLPLDNFAVLAPLDNFTFRARLAAL